MKDAEFLQYIYTREGETPRACAKNESGSFSNIDTCWSLDSSDQRGRSLGGQKGQAERLRQVVKGYLSSHPGVELTIVGWSQGGVLAAYAAQEYAEFAGVKNIVTLDSPLRGINSLGAGPLRHNAGCGKLDDRYDSAWDMLPSDEVIRTIDSTRRPGPGLFTVEEEGKDCFLTLCLNLIDNYHSQADWQTQHLRVHTGNHGTVWKGSGDSGETRALRDYIVCVIALSVEQTRCSEYAKNPWRFLIKLRETVYETLTIPPGARLLQLFARWPGSTVETTLITPSGRVINSDTVASDVEYAVSPVSEGFDIENPEPGEWRIELYGADVDPNGEDVALTVVTLPDTSSDADGDTIWDAEDSCPGVYNPSQSDADDDGIGDACDDDHDNDGVPNVDDNCQFVPNPGQEDVNANTIGDACDPDLLDLDGDGVLDGLDNCPFVPNSDQADSNGDGLGDACDAAGVTTPTPTPTAAVTPTPTLTPTPTPTPAGSGGPALKQGDVDCDGDSDAVDALKVLRHVASLPVSPGPGCPAVESQVAGHPFGDVDCDDDVDAVDALKVLRYVASLPVQQSEECTDIGEALGQWSQAGSAAYVQSHETTAWPSAGLLGTTIPVIGLVGLALRSSRHRQR